MRNSTRLVPPREGAEALPCHRPAGGVAGDLQVENMKNHAPENHAGARPTKRRPPRVCTWCESEFTDGRGDYCSDEHRRLARTIQAGSIPQRPCPRCGCNDLRVASAEFAICQTCGFQPTRPELLIVELTPPASVGMKRVKREILDEHGGEVFFANRPGGKRP